MDTRGHQTRTTVLLRDMNWSNWMIPCRTLCHVLVVAFEQNCFLMKMTFIVWEKFSIFQSSTFVKPSVQLLFHWVSRKYPSYTFVMAFWSTFPWLTFCHMFYWFLFLFLHDLQLTLFPSLVLHLHYLWLFKFVSQLIDFHF